MAWCPAPGLRLVSAVTGSRAILLPCGVAHPDVEAAALEALKVRGVKPQARCSHAGHSLSAACIEPERLPRLLFPCTRRPASIKGPARHPVKAGTGTAGGVRLCTPLCMPCIAPTETDRGRRNGPMGE